MLCNVWVFLNGGEFYIARSVWNVACQLRFIQGSNWTNLEIWEYDRSIAIIFIESKLITDRSNNGMGVILLCLSSQRHFSLIKTKLPCFMWPVKWRWRHTPSSVLVLLTSPKRWKLQFGFPADWHANARFLHRLKTPHSSAVHFSIKDVCIILPSCSRNVRVQELNNKIWGRIER